MGLRRAHGARARPSSSARVPARRASRVPCRASRVAVRTPKGAAAGVPPHAMLACVQEGKVVTSIRMGFDEEVVDKHQFVGRDERGMPKPEGEVTQVVGANFEITKICDNTVDEALRESIRSLCIGASEALNRYYAFGSVFSEDM